MNVIGTKEDHIIEVFYVDRETGWGVAKFNTNRVQLGDPEFYHHESDALERAQEFQMPVHFFNSDGELESIIANDD